MSRLTKTYSNGTDGASDNLTYGENSYDYKIIKKLNKNLQAIKDIAFTSCSDVKDSENIKSLCEDICEDIQNIFVVKSNGDRIRHMSDSELALFLENFKRGCIPDNLDGVSDKECNNTDCKTCMMKHRTIKEYISAKIK